MPFKERERGQTYSEATMATKQHIEAAQKSLAALIQFAADNRYSDESIGIRFRARREEFNCLTAAEQVRASEWPTFPESCHAAEHTMASSDKCLLLYFETKEARDKFSEWLIKQS